MVFCQLKEQVVQSQPTPRRNTIALFILGKVLILLQVSIKI